MLSAPSVPCLLLHPPPAYAATDIATAPPCKPPVLGLNMPMKRAKTIQTDVFAPVLTAVCYKSFLQLLNRVSLFNIYYQNGLQCFQSCNSSYHFPNIYYGIGLDLGALYTLTGLIFTVMPLSAIIQILQLRKQVWWLQRPLLVTFLQESTSSPASPACRM